MQRAQTSTIDTFCRTLKGEINNSERTYRNNKSTIWATTDSGNSTRKLFIWHERWEWTSIKCFEAQSWLSYLSWRFRIVCHDAYLQPSISCWWCCWGIIGRINKQIACRIFEIEQEKVIRSKLPLNYLTLLQANMLRSNSVRSFKKSLGKQKISGQYEIKADSEMNE